MDADGHTGDAGDDGDGDGHGDGDGDGDSDGDGDDKFKQLKTNRTHFSISFIH